MSIFTHGVEYGTKAEAEARIAELNEENLRVGASDGRVTEILSIMEAMQLVGWEQSPAEEFVGKCVFPDGSIEAYPAPTPAKRLELLYLIARYMEKNTEVVRAISAHSWTDEMFVFQFEEEGNEWVAWTYIFMGEEGRRRYEERVARELAEEYGEDEYTYRY